MCGRQWGGKGGEEREGGTGQSRAKDINSLIKSKVSLGSEYYSLLPILDGCSLENAQ